VISAAHRPTLSVGRFGEGRDWRFTSVVAEDMFVAGFSSGE